METTNPLPAGTGTCSSRQAFGVGPDDSQAEPPLCAIQAVADEAGRWRRLYHDALGRLTRVDEGRTQVPGDPPLAGGSFYVTTYAYDVLDRLTAVNKCQEGGASGQIRFFEYDGLGRLTSAELPEYNQLAMTYEYDDLGNVTDKNLDGGAYSETLTYDAFNRLTTRGATFDTGATNDLSIQYEYEYDEPPR